MDKKIIDKILWATTLVSGIYGLTNVDLTKSATALSKEKWGNALSVEETSKGLKISIGIIVDAEVRTKVIAYQINSSIKSFMSKESLKLDKVNIYVRGIK